ncbi:MAG: DNA repair protein RadA [Kiritimatiellaceae bacterium]|nr:DNA repair protein RadA [Kiritimatiellaceae bacterium]
MIPIQLGTILILFVSLPLSIIAVLSLFYNFRARHRPTREKESIYECDECGHVYAIARSRPMDRCPRCGLLNEVVRT